MDWEESLLMRRSLLHYALLTARSFSTLVTPHDAILQCVSVHRVSQVHELP